MVAFDVFVHNVDRRRDNTNLLIGQDERDFIVFDHGEAFGFIWDMIGADNRVDPAIAPMLSVLTSHALALCVRHGPPDLSEFRARLADLGPWC